MSKRHRAPLGGVLVGLWLAGCGSGVGLGSAGGGGGPSAAQSGTGTSAGVSGMSSGNTSGTAGSSASIEPLASALWQEMKIQVSAIAPSQFTVADGQTQKTVKAPRNASLQMVVDVTDNRTGVQIPYASVEATIRRRAKVVYRGRQLPMLSESMGSDYANNVALPGPGRYELSLVISPPVGARHLEYRNVWLTSHTVHMSFVFNPRT